MTRTQSKNHLPQVVFFKNLYDFSPSGQSGAVEMMVKLETDKSALFAFPQANKACTKRLSIHYVFLGPFGIYTERTSNR
jgi:hypothetical protein